MTPEAAIAHAEAVLVQNQTANGGYLSNGELLRHAATAEILIDQATQLDAVQTELVTLKRVLAEREYHVTPIEDGLDDGA